MASPTQNGEVPKEASVSSGSPAPSPAGGVAAPESGSLAPGSSPAAGSNGTAAPTPSTGSTTNSTSGQPNTSLYVGELDGSVTEAQLFGIFSTIGQVASIRVCRDAVTRRSLGYAYVNFLNAADAERALDQLNYSLIKNKACRIMWSQRDPSLRKTGQGNIFIKNLDETIDNKALHDTFAAFGEILSCKVATDESGNSCGYGFVHYVTGESAEAAIEGVNNMQLNDKVVFVGRHIPRRERQAKIDEVRNNYTNIYVKNIPLEDTTKELTELFAKFGTITSATVQTKEGKSCGFGFVNYEKHESAKKAVDALHDKDYKGNTLYVARAQSRSERDEELRKAHEQQKYETTLKYQGVNLYVKNLDDDCNEAKLEAKFAPFGTITSCKVVVDAKTGAPSGFGFVCYSTPDEATKAMAEMNGKMLGSKPLYVSLAQRKEVRKQQLEAQMSQRAQMRNQQLAAAGIPGVPYGMPGGVTTTYQRGYAYPPQGRGGIMYPSQTMHGMPPRRYTPADQMPPMGMPGPYGQPPQDYRNPAYANGPGSMPAPGGVHGVPLAGPAGRGAPLPSMNGRGSIPASGPDGMRPAPTGAVPPRSGPYPPSQPAPATTRPLARAPEPQPSGLNPAALAKASPAEQKQMLGEALYPHIAEKQPEKAGKITGMLLECDNAEILYLVEDPVALNAKVQEALTVLEEYERNNSGSMTALDNSQ